MTETVLRVLLSELKTVRIRCKQNGCQGVIELPTSKLVHFQPSAAKCPSCGEAFAEYFGQRPNPFHALGMAVDSLEHLNHAFEIEFPIKIDRVEK
jgi:hypothetical protein